MVKVLKYASRSLIRPACYEWHHVFVMQAMLRMAEIHYSKWHFAIDQAHQRDAEGLITWIELIYANTFKC